MSEHIVAADLPDLVGLVTALAVPTNSAGRELALPKRITCLVNQKGATPIGHRALIGDFSAVFRHSPLPHFSQHAQLKVPPTGKPEYSGSATGRTSRRH